MHETALAEGVVDLVREAARTHGFARVRAVRLELGALSHVDPHAIEFCFAAAAKGSPAEGAALVLDRLPGRAWCLACAVEVPLAHRADPCPRCGGSGLMVTGGEEMRVKDMEVV